MSSPNAEFEQTWTSGTSCSWKNPSPSNPRTQKGLEKHSTWEYYTQTSNLGGTKEQRDYHDKKADFQMQTARDTYNHYSDGVSATAQAMKSWWGNCKDCKRQALHSNLTCDVSCDFHGKRVQFVQIGLGTHTTFVQNFGGESKEWSPTLAWLAENMSETRPSRIRGVCAEPVPEIVIALQPTLQALPYVCLLQAGIGEFDRRNEEVVGLSMVACEKLMEALSPEARRGVDWYLQYLRNMSSVGEEHPYWAECCEQVRLLYKVVLSTIRRQVDIWSYETLASTLNFVGCDVLLIDAEGHDARILRSVIRHCKKCPAAWPGMIRFETQGHCDTREGRGTEWGIIRSLQKKGYLLVAYSKYDTYLVHRRRLGRDARLRRWILTWFCIHCGKHRKFPYILRRNWNAVCWDCRTKDPSWNEAWCR